MTNIFFAALVGALLGAVPLGLLGLMGYARLQQTVKDQPKMMRLEMKLEIREGIERHIAQYRHEENTGVRPRPLASSVEPIA